MFFWINEKKNELIQHSRPKITQPSFKIAKIIVDLTEHKSSFCWNLNSLNILADSFPTCPNLYKLLGIFVKGLILNFKEYKNGYLVCENLQFFLYCHSFF